jgi:hypothetical protein
MPIALSIVEGCARASSGLEYWSGEVMGSRANHPILQYSNTPLLQHSIRVLSELSPADWYYLTVAASAGRRAA